MNKKGFTLAEMLLVVVLIGIVTAATIPGISDMIEKNNEKKMEGYCKLVSESTRMYLIDKENELKSETSSTITKSLTDLKKVTPDLDLEEWNNATITITKGATYSYEISLFNEDNEEHRCGSYETGIKSET